MEWAASPHDPGRVSAAGMRKFIGSDGWCLRYMGRSMSFGIQVGLDFAARLRSGRQQAKRGCGVGGKTFRNPPPIFLSELTCAGTLCK
jgi:hypothetical protein